MDGTPRSFRAKLSYRGGREDLSRPEDMLSTILLPLGNVKAVIVDQDSVGGGDDKDDDKAKAASALAATIETLRLASRLPVLQLR